MSRVRVFALLLAMLVVVAACTEEGRDELSDRLDESGVTLPDAPDDGDEAAPEPPPDTTAAPEAPPETSPPSEGEGTTDDEGLPAEAIGLLLLVLGLGLVIMLLASRRQSSTQVTQQVPPVAAAVPQWRDRAGSTYADARWIHDNATDATATWRAAHRRGGAPTDPSDRVAAVSNSLDGRISAALNEGYQLEAAASTQEQRDAARAVGAGISSVQSSFDARVSAHEARLAQSQSASADLARADEAAATQLANARQQLAGALDGLSRTM